MAVKIITDSTSDITQQQAKELGIEVLPLTINIDGEIYTDGINITKQEFYEKQSVAKEIPVTSQIPFSV
ncbi:MAG: DegV family protein, partial [Oscillospiraceae bacterium]